MVEFGVLGPVAAWDGEGRALDLKGPRHRAVLARLIAAQGRVVSVDRLVDDLWEEPPAGAVGAVRTFVAALRRALEPDRPPRSPARLLVTDGPGYALRTEAVDARRFERAVAESASAASHHAFAMLDGALARWRGPAYAELGDRPWVSAERRRLEELRSAAVERRGEALLALGRAAEAVPDLDAHASAHPWREETWRLLALALYRSGRQAEALAVVRKASGLLRDRLGLDPSRRLRGLETDLLRHTADAGGADALWERASTAFTQVRSVGAGARIESTVGLLRGLAVTGAGGLETAGGQRVATVEAAERLGDPRLTARVIGAYDVPAVWTRSDDPARAAWLRAAADRTLKALGPDATPVVKARLLAAIAMESRGTGGPREAAAAREAERIARELRDPALLAFALNGVFMQSCHRAGLAPERSAIGAELVDLAARHDLASFGILGHLIRMQARSALADFTAADEDAAAAASLADRHERPLVSVFTAWYRAMRTAATDSFAAAETAYREAAARLQGSGMPGVETGLEALALLCLRVRHGEPAAFPDGTDWGPYEPWARPLLLAAHGHRDAAGEALRRTPRPPNDLLLEALWTLTARAAIDLGDLARLHEAREALAPAVNELAGAGSGMLTAGPVASHLADLDAAIAAQQ
ncbi:winged helix-turn-helix domain-containing protein [Glycomyces sp. TRM65418]|uniref:BTAD domain-containing putative transcriptional regulator n=1 Tax=Glycomyces sp. TRM65418 TaxID=2867006 RepID=UPI001CE7159B|nr:BTAD domain-containing putative transcriptional regulator [Glycomyces sp. TRM65418]MCC3763804.1 winged helix-turn-helix domain-containing protein [Glycomyces sp. TRM65418]QZD53512.1 winged helix-turn-helix domain-containing protein [Glycomyces sp. TRM65418]